MMRTRFFCLIALFLLMISLCACQRAADTPDVDIPATESAGTQPSQTDLVLVSGGEAKVKMIRPEDVPNDVLTEITRLYQTIGEVTGVYLEYTTDFLRGSQSRTAEADAEPAILAGQTNYSASFSRFDGLTYGQGVIGVSGQQLVLAVADKTTAVQAVDTLCAYIRANGRAGELTIPADYAVEIAGSEMLAELPVAADCIYTGREEVGDGAYTMTFIRMTRAEYDAYLEKMEASTLTHYADYAIGKNAFATYISDAYMFQLVYTEADQMLRIILDKQAYSALPPTEMPSYTKVCDASLTQLGLEYNYDAAATPYVFTESNWQIGMCYIFRLEDGSFILIDGGFNKSRNAKLLWDKLRELSSDYRPDKITIAAWFLTHAHGDHYGTFAQFMQSYGQMVNVGYLIYNTGSAAQYAACGESPDAMLKAAATYVPKANTIIARPGQHFSLANAEVEILFTDELLGSNEPKSGNSLCVQFRITIAGQTFMFSGDSNTDATDRVVRLYGSALASDFVQVIHHGAPGGTIAYYQCVNPSIVLWPLGEYDYYPDPSNPSKVTRSRETYNAFLYTSDKVREIILAGHTDRTLPLPYTFPTGTVVLPTPAA